MQEAENRTNEFACVCESALPTHQSFTSATLFHEIDSLIKIRSRC